MLKNVFSKLVVLLIIILNVWFVRKVFVVVATPYTDVPDSLIYSWFAFTGTEIAAMAGIKIKKMKHAAKIDIQKKGEMSNDNY